jgi:RNA-directed DNA polymerase
MSTSIGSGTRSPRWSATRLRAVDGFEHEADARRFLEAMRARLAAFALSLNPDKTRIIAFGRHAAANRAARGLGKASTGSAGNLQLPRLPLHLRPITGAASSWSTGNPAAIRVRAKLKEAKDKPRMRMRRPLPETGKRLGQAVRGFMNRRAVPTDSRAIDGFRESVLPLRLARARRAQQPRQDSLGPVQAARRPLPATSPHPPALAGTAVRSQTPEVGAV